MADNEDELVDYDEEEVRQILSLRSNSRQQLGAAVGRISTCFLHVIRDNLDSHELFESSFDAHHQQQQEVANVAADKAATGDAKETKK